MIVNTILAHRKRQNVRASTAGLAAAWIRGDHRRSAAQRTASDEGLSAAATQEGSVRPSDRSPRPAQARLWDGRAGARRGP